MTTTRGKVRALQTEITTKQRELAEVPRITPIPMLCEELHELLCWRHVSTGCTFKIENLRDDRMDSTGEAYWELATFLNDEVLRTERMTPDERRLYGDDESRAGVERVLTLVDLFAKTGRGYRPLKAETLRQRYSNRPVTLAALAVSAAYAEMGTTARAASVTNLEAFAARRETVTIGDAVYIGGQKGEVVAPVTGDVIDVPEARGQPGAARSGDESGPD